MSTREKWSGRFAARVVACVALFVIVFVVECLYIQSRFGHMDFSGPKVFEFMMIMQALGFVPLFALLPVAAIVILGVAYLPALFLWWITGPRIVVDKPLLPAVGPSSTRWRPPK